MGIQICKAVGSSCIMICIVPLFYLHLSTPPPIIHTFSLSFIWVFRVNHTWIKIHEHDSAIQRSGVQGMLWRVWRNTTLFVKYHKTVNLLYVFPLMKKFYNSLAYRLCLFINSYGAKTILYALKTKTLEGKRQKLGLTIFESSWLSWPVSYQKKKLQK